MKISSRLILLRASAVLSQTARGWFCSSICPFLLNQIGHQLRNDTNQALSTIESNDIAVKEWSTVKFSKIEGIIEDLAAVRQQSVASLDTSLREQVKAEIVDLRSAVDKIGDGGGGNTEVQTVMKLTQLESHFMELSRSVKELQGKIAVNIDLAQQAGSFAQTTAAKVEQHEQ